MIEHVPMEKILTVEPEMVQTVVVIEVKVTGSAESDEAETVNGPIPMVTLYSGPNAMVCITGPTEAVSVALARLVPAVVTVASLAVLDTEVGALGETFTVAEIVGKLELEFSESPLVQLAGDRVHVHPVPVSPVRLRVEGNDSLTVAVPE